MVHVVSLLEPVNVSEPEPTIVSNPSKPLGVSFDCVITLFKLPLCIPFNSHD